MIDRYLSRGELFVLFDEKENPQAVAVVTKEGEGVYELKNLAVAAPFGWWMGLHWLEGFAEKTPIRPWVFLASFLLVTVITMTTVTVQSWRNANENPANSIKTE